jgi:NAD+-dependent protein deacetylase SIR2
LECTACQKEEEGRLNEGKRIQGKGFLLLRVWFYNEFGFLDQDAINEVTAKDIRTKPNAVIVVGTALKVQSVKHLT